MPIEEGGESTRKAIHPPIWGNAWDLPGEEIGVREVWKGATVALEIP
jgi:hypothetical protein